MTYTTVRSNFVKKKIQGMSWKNRLYIDRLIQIERHVLGEAYGLGSGYIRQSLEDDYPKEFSAIFQELNPVQYAKNRERERMKAIQERINDKKRKEEEQNETRNAKEEWIRAGGTG